MWYFVEYNGRLLKATKRVMPAVDFIHRKGLKDDSDNKLVLVDSQGDTYNPYTGQMLYPWEITE